jgi:hypothetical protein
MTIPERNNLKGGKIYFGSQLWRFQSKVSWINFFEARLHVIGAGAGGRGCPSQGSRETE